MKLEKIKELLKPDARYVEVVEETRDEWAGRIFAAQTLDVRLSDGSAGWREIVRHHGGAGVCAVRDGMICLVRQYRVALGRMTLEIPAGKLDVGEDPAVCAARELVEETGLVADEMVPIAVSAGSVGFCDERTRIFLARGLRQDEARPDEGELVDVVWLPVMDMVEAIREGLIEDSKTIIAVFAAAASLV
jgi:ADP-ribose pyrophosphatase